MPLIDGFEIMELIFNIDSNIKVILISWYALTQEELMAFSNISYLKKPITITKLIETIKKRINSNEINT